MGVESGEGGERVVTSCGMFQKTQETHWALLHVFLAKLHCLLQSLVEATVVDINQILLLSECIWASRGIRNNDRNISQK